jgi:GT2 family glycosyltransferase
MDVSIVIVNWNGAWLLRACLDALRAQTRPADEVIVVDNASTDDSRALLVAEYPEVRVLPCGKNLGFAGGTNAGIAASRGAIVVALNNDTIARPDWLALLVAPLEADARLGATMSTMVFAHAPGTIAAAGIAVHRNGLALEGLLGTPLAALSATPRPIFGPSGGAAAYRRAMLDDVGHFDEDFFLYLEDVDLAWRARLRGWPSLHVPGAIVAHHYSASSGQGSPTKRYYLARNRLWGLRKNLPRGLALRYGAAIIAYDLAACLHALLMRDRAGLRGRRAGLGGAKIAARRGGIQHRRTATDGELASWLKPAPGPRALLRLQRDLARLTTAPESGTAIGNTVAPWEHPAS